MASGPLPIACQDSTGIPATDLPAATLGDQFRTAAVVGLVDPLVAVYRDRFRLSPHVLAHCRPDFGCGIIFGDGVTELR